MYISMVKGPIQLIPHPNKVLVSQSKSHSLLILKHISQPRTHNKPSVPQIMVTPVLADVKSDQVALLPIMHYRRTRSNRDKLCLVVSLHNKNSNLDFISQMKCGKSSEQINLDCFEMDICIQFVQFCYFNLYSFLSFKQMETKPQTNSYNDKIF